MLLENVRVAHIKYGHTARMGAFILFRANRAAYNRLANEETRTWSLQKTLVPPLVPCET